MSERWVRPTKDRMADILRTSSLLDRPRAHGFMVALIEGEPCFCLVSVLAVETGYAELGMNEGGYPLLIPKTKDRQIPPYFGKLEPYVELDEAMWALGVRDQLWQDSDREVPTKKIISQILSGVYSRPEGVLMTRQIEVGGASADGT